MIVKPQMWALDESDVARQWRWFHREAMVLLPLWSGGGDVRDVSYWRQSPTKNTLSTWGQGHRGYHLDLGDREDATIPDHVAFDDFTQLCIYFGLLGTSFEGVIASKRSAWSATGIPFELVRRGNGIGLRVVGNTSFSTYETPAGSWNDNEKHDGAAEWDGARIRIHIDGVQLLDAARTGTITNNATDIAVGSLPGGGDTLEGQMYYLYILRVAPGQRVAAQIAADPWAPMRRRSVFGLRAPAAGGGGTILPQMMQMVA